MQIVTFVKRVPDTESKIRINSEARTIVEDGLSYILSPYDEYAVEEAIRLKEAHGGQSWAVSVGREESATVLRKCLAMGIDEALLVQDDQPETFDGLRTARIIARLIERKFSSFDIFIFGKQAAGTDNGQVPSMVAALLGLPQVTVVVRLEIKGKEAVAWREIEGGLEKVNFSLPAVVSAQKGLNEPRYETLKGIMAAKKKAISTIALEELGLSGEDLLPSIFINNIEAPALKKAGRILTGDPAETARQLVDLLRNEAKAL